MFKEDDKGYIRFSDKTGKNIVISQYSKILQQSLQLLILTDSCSKDRRMVDFWDFRGSWLFSQELIVKTSEFFVY